MQRKAMKLGAIAFLLAFATGGLLPSNGASMLPAQPALAKQKKQNRVDDWFKRYDQIRHDAQMTDAERERSRRLMGESFAAAFVQSPQAAQDKAAASALLQKMVDRYHKAVAQLAQLAPIPETKKLQSGYNQYFQSAACLFGDYLRVQNNLFATDANGNGLLGQLQQRKSDLETLDAANKDLDSKLRAKYGIAPYPW
jgi:hypothetical protein